MFMKKEFSVKDWIQRYRIVEHVALKESDCATFKFVAHLFSSYITFSAMRFLMRELAPEEGYEWFGALLVIIVGTILISIVYQIVRFIILKVDWYVSFKSHYPFLKLLPFTLYSDKGWQQIMTAFGRIDKLKMPTGSQYKNLGKKLQNEMFSTWSYHAPRIHSPRNINDREISIVYKRKLATSPFVERLSYLLLLDSEEAIDGFNQQPDKVKIEFLQPFVEFLQFVQKTEKNEESKMDIIEEQLGASTVKQYKKAIKENGDIMLKQVLKRSKKYDTTNDAITEVKKLEGLN